MATITVKNIPDPVYEILKQHAAENHRSINSEIIYLIEQSTKCSKIAPHQHLTIARTLREKTKGFNVNDATLSDMKNDGRA